MRLRHEAFPYVPHECVWNPNRDSTRSGQAAVQGYAQTYATGTYAGSLGSGGSAVANDGKAPSLVPGGTVMLFLDPKWPQWAMQKYGVETEKTPYLVIGRVDDMRAMVKGDELAFGDLTLVLQTRPSIYPPTLGYEHGECMATLERTGGR